MNTDRDVSLRVAPQVAFNEVLLRKALGISPETDFIILKRSVDARRREVMVDMVCRLDPSAGIFTPAVFRDADPALGQAVIIGSGPAGLFAALRLLELGIKPVVLERGRDVHSRRVDIAGISTKGIVNERSNYSFGEGGAGAYSDGKLFTRSKKRGDNSKVLDLFVQFGADSRILYEAHPHIGTDRLPKIIENMRRCIIEHGGEVHFETQAVDLVINGGRVEGVLAESFGPAAGTGTGQAVRSTGENGLYPAGAHEYGAKRSLTEFRGPVILAVGNAARDTFEMLCRRGVAVESKDIAVGLRLEHPQKLIDCIQYHNPAGRGSFLPAAEYSFAAQVNGLGVYSFCMCPGGFVVPAASGKEQVVVNGMSPSNRGSRWANSGMVVELRRDMLRSGSFGKSGTLYSGSVDACGELYGSDFSHKADHGANFEANYEALEIMRFQQALELAAFRAAGCSQRAPAARMTDFMAHKRSSDLPASSYAPGLTDADLYTVLPELVAEALCGGFRIFGRQAPGFVTDQAVVMGVETRTSSPVRILRDRTNLQSVSHPGLYPCGEGAGYAGGIVSAAIDGMRCAEAVAGYKTAAV